MQFENHGTAVGEGFGTPAVTAGTDYPKTAYEIAAIITPVAFYAGWLVFIWQKKCGKQNKGGNNKDDL